MFFNCHTTRKVERDAVQKTPYELIEIDPLAFHDNRTVKPIVWEEDTEDFYEHDIKDFLDVLVRMDKYGDFNWENTEYFNHWKYKGAEIHTRLHRLYNLYQSIKQNGVKEPIACEITGERLDGSFRTKIAIHLGIPKLKAKLYRFNWRDITENFILRKLASRELSSGKDYYEFEYGYKDWKNINAGPIYRENASRWSDIIPLIKGKTVLDIGCNEGYISLMAARNGFKVEGIDLEWNHLAYLNKLVFEWVDKKDIDAEFYEEDLMNTNRTADTILLLNVLYHIPKDKQQEFLMKFKGKQLIFQCNLRKEKERNKYYTSHPDDLKELLNRCGIKITQELTWKDKPIIVCTP